MDSEQVKSLIQALKVGDDSTKLRAVQEITNQSKSDPNLKVIFAKNKGISALVKLICRTKATDLLLAILELLNDLSTKPVYAANMAKKSAVSILLPLLFPPTYHTSVNLPAATLLHTLSADKVFAHAKEPNAAQDAVLSLLHYLRSRKEEDAVRKLVLATLGNLGRTGAFHEVIKNNNGVEVLLAELRSTLPAKDESMQSIVRIIANAVAKPSISSSFGVNGITLLVNLLKEEGTQNTKVQVLRAISNLAINPENQDSIVKLGAVQMIVNLLRNPTLCEHAAASLRFLTAGHANCQQIVLTSGGIPLLMDMIKSGTTNGKAQAALAIFFLVQQKPIQDVAAASIPLLVDLISNEDEHCKINAIKALGSLAKKHNGNKATICACKGLAQIISYLKAQKEKRADSTEALGHMAGTLESNNQILGLDGLPLLLDIMSSNDNKEQSAASETLAHILETSPVDSALCSAIINSKSLFPTVQQILAGTSNLKHSTIHLLGVLLNFTIITFPINVSQLVDFINSGGSTAVYALRILHYEFNAGPEDESTTDLQRAVPGLAAALRSTDPTVPPSHFQLASFHIMRLLADPALVASVAPQVDIQRVVMEWARADIDNVHALPIGADAIWTLLETDTKWESAVVQGGGIRACVRLLFAPQEDLLRAGLSIARILAFAYSDNIAREGGMSLLLSLVMEQQDLQLRALAAQTLWMVLMNCSEVAEDMLEKEGAVDVLVEFLSKQDNKSQLNLQIKSFIEQALFILRLANRKGFTSITEDLSKYKRACVCVRKKHSLMAFDSFLQLISLCEGVTVELTIHSLACNNSNEFFLHSSLVNILLFIKLLPEKVLKEITDYDSWLRFISIVWMQPEPQLISIGVKILAMFLEKGSVLPQTPLVELVASQIRSLPPLDVELRDSLDQCIKALNTAAKYPTKEPYYAQISEVNSKLAARDTEIQKLTAQVTALSQKTDKSSESNARIQDLEAQVVKAANAVKQAKEEKKQDAEQLAKKEARIKELEAEAAKLNTNAASQASVSESKLADAQREIQKLKQELHKTAASKKEKEADRESQKDRRISELQNEMSRMKNQAAADKKAVEELETMVEKVTSENTDIYARILELEEQHHTTLQQLDEKQKQLLEVQMKPGGTLKREEILDAINPTLVQEIGEIETLEAMLEAKLNLTRTRKYQLHKSVVDRLNEQIHCPICMAKTRNVALTPCGHTYCSDCAKSIAEKSKKCPVCRKPTKSTLAIYL